MFFIILGKTLKVPKTPEASLLAKVLASVIISLSVILLEFLIADSKSSKTNISSLISSLRDF